MMKTIIIFYETKSKYADQKVFDGKSAKEITQNWADMLGFPVFNACGNTTLELVDKLAQIATEQKADNVIFAYDDCPFLDAEVTKQILETHEEYKAEYTFADGYPYGFTPEVIAAGTLRILAELGKTTAKAEGEKELCRESIFNLIKTDINSFDVESVIASEDWRLLRFAFHCGSKDSFMQCQGLWNKAYEKAGEKACEKAGEKAVNTREKNTADVLAEIAAGSKECLKTVPGFYNLQVSDQVLECIYSPVKKNDLPGKMSLADFSKLVDQIAEFSEKAVISVSKFGEFFAHSECVKMVEKVLEHPGLSVFIETEGECVTEQIALELGKVVQSAAPRTNGWQKVMVAVRMDAFTAKTYSAVRGGAAEDGFAKAMGAVAKLSDAMPGCVYPQFVRMNENETELENFYRYWNEKSNASGGNVIIQKYNSFAGALPQRKVADLTPLERNVCWHLRRDMEILANGDVLPCHCFALDGVIGNVFKEDLASVWKKTDEMLCNHINKKYCEKCGKCDEFYTFNF